MLEIQENIQLKDFTTFKIGGPARYFAIIKNESDLREAFIFIKSRKLPLFVLGGGSNLLVSDHGFPGLVIKNEIKGTKFIDHGKEFVTVEIGSGETLDDVVALSVIRNLAGLENLSGVPGTIGGAAVQNAGAYGVELKDRILNVKGLNSKTGKDFSFDNFDCQYGYRSSIFKKNKKFIITSIVLKLQKEFVPNIEYAGLKDQLANQGDLTRQKIRDTILQIRAEKLPDWHKLGTAGSFFKNPVVTDKKYQALLSEYADLPGFEIKKGSIKIPAGWILDKIFNLKGYREGNVGLYEKQAIVVLNFGMASGAEVLAFVEKNKKNVKDKIGIILEEEVEKLSTD